MAKALHRDDVPAEVAEAIFAELKRIHPGAQVRYAGDGPLSPEMAEKTAQLHSELERLMCEGLCMDCEKKMPNWPDAPDDMNEEWQPAAGWKHFNDMTGEIVGWQCPECDKAEEAKS